MTVSLELDMMDLIDLSNPPKYVHQDFHLPVKSALQENWELKWIKNRKFFL